MKATSRESGFRPVDVVITLETEEEAIKFFSIFNHDRIIQFIGGTSIFEALGGSDSLFYSEEVFLKFAEAIKK